MTIKSKNETKTEVEQRHQVEEIKKTDKQTERHEKEKERESYTLSIPLYYTHHNPQPAAL